MAFHRPGKTFTLGNADHVNLLTDHKVFGRQFGAHVNKAIVSHTELGQYSLRFHLGFGKMATHRLGGAFDLGLTGAQLNGVISVFVHCFMGNHLHIVHMQNSHRHMLAPFGKNT